MIVVEGQPFDLEHARERAEDSREQFANLRAQFPDQPSASNLHSSASSLSSAIDRIAAVHPTSTELLELGHFVAFARAALFTWVRRRERNRWLLLGRERALQGSVDAEEIMALHWRAGFWLAWTTRDAEALALLIQTPVEQFVGEWESYDRPFILALQALFTRDPRMGGLLVKALELADPNKVNRSDPDWILYGLVPQFNCLIALADRDQQQFEQALGSLLELLRDYWVRSDPQGELVVSIEALGLVAWARTVGIEIAVASPYVPSGLVDVKDPTAIVCAACMTPFTSECKGCGRSATAGSRTLAFRAWFELPREACAACAHRFPCDARTCPVCHTTRRSMNS